MDFTVIRGLKVTNIVLMENQSVKIIFPVDERNMWIKKPATVKYKSNDNRGE